MIILWDTPYASSFFNNYQEELKLLNILVISSAGVNET